MRRFSTVLGVLSLALAPSVALAAGNPHGGPPGQATTHSQGSAGTSGTYNQPQPLSGPDSNSGGANGKCPGGPYCSTRNGAPSLNGNGNGLAVGKPCAGCVGKADNKNPQGQYPNGSDHNNGYECDGNHGIGKTNPAHTGCTSAASSSPSSPPNSSGSPPNSSSGSPPNSSASAAGQSPSGKQGTPPGSTPGTVGGISSTATPTSGSHVGATPSSGTPPLERSPQFASLRTPATRTSGSLPFTGIDVAAVILTGCLLLGAGMMGLGLAQLRAASQRKY